MCARSFHATPRPRHSYIASPDTAVNANYLGPAPLAVLAATVATAVGPSGHNSEYVYRLADAMRHLGVEDGALFELERAVRALRAAAGTEAAAAPAEEAEEACGGESAVTAS
jgi:cation transport protein ChaC